jgi:D-alanine-D-alanine ligase
MTAILKPILPPKLQKILVLLGGWSHEKEISCRSGEKISEALRTLGHQVETFNPPRDAYLITKGIRDSFSQQGPDLIFNALHGLEVEDGTIQGILSLMGLPYTASGVVASSVAMHKGLTADVAAFHGVQVPRGETISISSYQERAWSYPHIVKDVRQGSTVGLFLIRSAAEGREMISDWSFGPDVRVEDYIPGRELTVGVFDGHAMDVLEIEFDGAIFDYGPKYTAGKAQHICPAHIPPHVAERAKRWAEQVHNVLGCRGITRTDFRYNPDDPREGGLYFLEINTQPGMTDISLVPDIAKTHGWSYLEVIQWAVDHAVGI